MSRTVDLTKRKKPRITAASLKNLARPTIKESGEGALLAHECAELSKEARNRIRALLSGLDAEARSPEGD